MKVSATRLQQYRQQQAIAKRRQRMQQQAKMRQPPPPPVVTQMPAQHQRLMNQNKLDMLNQQRFNANRGAPPKVQKNVLFYSEHCPHSKKFINALKNVPKVCDSFTFVCVDKRGMKLPRCIKVVPTIVVYDSTERRQLLADYRAFEWLNHVIDVPIDITNCKPGHLGTKLSDQYSWLDDETEENDYAFAFIDEIESNNGNNFIFTVEEDGTDKSQLRDENEVNFNRLQQARENDPFINKGATGAGRPPPTLTTEVIRKKNTINDSDFNRIMQERKRTNQNLRKPVPMHGPNFTSGSFRSTGFQSHRGPGYVPAGENVLQDRSKAFDQVESKKLMSRLMAMRQREMNSSRKPPPKKVDWTRNLKPMKVL